MILTRVPCHLALDQLSAVFRIRAARVEDDPSRGGVKEIRSHGVNNAGRIINQVMDIIEYHRLNAPTGGEYRLGSTIPLG